MTGVHKGDHIYFQAADGPLAGQVKAVGEHGCTVCCDGRNHLVKWRHVLGHKQRMQHAVRIVDQGEDGALVEDEDGRRRYLAGKIAAAGEVIEPADPETAVPDAQRNDEDEPMRKALIPDDAQVLFLKGGPIKNRPGLSLKDITDKSGRHSKHWVKTTEDAPADKRRGGDDEPRGSEHGYGTHDIEAGDHIEFKTPSLQGAGTVVAAGKDGATIEDEHGNQHSIRWKFVTGFKGGDGADGSGGGDGGNGDGGEAAAGDDDGNSLADQVKQLIADSRKVLSPQDPVSADKFSAADYYRRQNDAQVTKADILGIFPDEVTERINNAVERLKQIEETVELFKPNGEYTDKRREKHAEVFAKFMSPEQVEAARPAEGEPPTAFILGGRGGSGKGWFKNKVYDPNKAIVLDPDAVKEELPEYEGWNAFQLHEESSELIDAMLQECQRQGLNIVLDKTLKTEKTAVQSVEALKAEGYRIEAHYMFLPRQEAAKRAVGRFIGKSGRYVPVPVVLGNTTNEATFDAVRKLADAWSFRDNNVAEGDEPVLICSHGETHGQDERSDRSVDSGERGEVGRRRLSGGRADAKNRNRGSGVSGEDAGTQKGQGPLKKALILLRAPFARLRKSEPVAEEWLDTVDGPDRGEQLTLFLSHD
ncbi:MAG TPA: zeta toxin family protein [Gammaproteobacteria bacterium]|nr:zeta toxin family protein [Gammaproteobacteria bacterium]